GVMLLLFLIGLEINFSSLRIVGKSIAVTAIVQVVLSSAGGILIGLLFGWPLSWAVFTGVLTAFGSTVVLVKILGEQHELKSLHGKLAIGILLTQDILAMLLLTALTPHKADAAAWSVLMAILKIAVLFGVTIWIGRVIIPKILNYIARTP